MFLKYIGSQFFWLQVSEILGWCLELFTLKTLLSDFGSFKVLQ